MAVAMLAYALAGSKQQVFRHTSEIPRSLNDCCGCSGGCCTRGWGAGADVGCCGALVVAFAPPLLNEFGCCGVIGVEGVGVGGCSASDDGVAAAGFALFAAAAVAFFEGR